MACSARGANDQGRVLHPSIVTVETGLDSRAPFSSTRALSGLVASWGSARGVNDQGQVLHPSVAAVETGLNGRAPCSSIRALAGLVAGWGSAHGVNGQGRVLHPSVAAVETGPNGRASFSSSTRTLVGLVAGWTSLAKNEIGLFVGITPHREIPRATDPRNTRRTDFGELGVAVELVCRPGAAIGVAVGGGLVV